MLLALSGLDETAAFVRKAISVSYLQSSFCRLILEKSTNFQNDKLHKYRRDYSLLHGFLCSNYYGMQPSSEGVDLRDSRFLYQQPCFVLLHRHTERHHKSDHRPKSATLLSLDLGFDGTDKGSEETTYCPRLTWICVGYNDNLLLALLTSSGTPA